MSTLHEGGRGEGTSTAIFGMSAKKMREVKLEYEARKKSSLVTKLRLAFYQVSQTVRRLLNKWIGWLQVLRTARLRYSVYVLECNNYKYYVGSTQRPLTERWREHMSPRGGSMWTRTYKPQRILHSETTKHIPPQYYLGVESRVTAKLMMIHGINNVRGAQFSDPRNLTLLDLPALVGFIGHNLEMDYKEVEALLLARLPEPSGAGGLGLGLGTSGAGATSTNETVKPFVRTPRATSRKLKAMLGGTAAMDDLVEDPTRHARSTTLGEVPYALLDQSLAKESSVLKEATVMYCVRCGRTNHNVDNCFATTTISGRAIIGGRPSARGGKNAGCFRCGRAGHFQKTCAYEYDAVGRLIGDDRFF